MSSLTSRSAPNRARFPEAAGLTDPAAERRFREIVPPLLDDAYSLAKWLSRSPTDAEDIVQDAALRALSALSTVSVDRPKPWFLAIVRNAAMSFMARNRRETLAYAGDLADLEALDSREGDDAAPNPEQALIAMQDGERLRAGDRAPPLALSRDARHARRERPLLSRDRGGDRGAGRHGDVQARPRARHARQDPEARAMTRIWP